DANDSALVQIAQHVFADVRNVTRNFFGAEFGIAGLDFQLLDVNRSVVILFHQALGNQNRVFEVITTPRHERDQHITSQRQFAAICARSVGNYLALGDALTDVNDWALIDAGVLIRTLELDQRVDVRGHFARDCAVDIVIGSDDYSLRVDLVNRAVASSNYHCARVACRHVFHAGADIRRFSAQQGHRLALHIRTHQRAVRVIVFQKWNQRGRHRNQLFRRHVNIFNFIALRENEFSSFARGVALVDDVTIVVKFDIGLTDDVLVFFPRGQIKRMGIIARLFAVGADTFVRFVNIVLRHVLARLELCLAAIDDPHVLDDTAVNNLAIRRFDKPKLINARIARKARDKSDVRSFRRLDRANAAVVSRVYIAYFESRALAAQSSGSQRGQTTLVRDL